MKIENLISMTNGLKLITAGRHEDRRGYFHEVFNESQLSEYGVPAIKQVNESYSAPHVMRGLHFQSKPFMGKLVRTISGHMVDMCLDIRPGSPSFGKLFLIDMPEHPNKTEWLYIPAGFAHGNIFLVPTRIEYLCTGEYNAASEFCISPLKDDFEIVSGEREYEIFCGFKSDPNLVITDKDRAGMTLHGWTNCKDSEDFVFKK